MLWSLTALSLLVVALSPFSFGQLGKRGVAQHLDAKVGTLASSPHFRVWLALGGLFGVALPVVVTLLKPNPLVLWGAGVCLGTLAAQVGLEAHYSRRFGPHLRVLVGAVYSSLRVVQLVGLSVVLHRLEAHGLSYLTTGAAGFWLANLVWLVSLLVGARPEGRS